MADILSYLVQLIDSSIPIYNDIGSESSRVEFLNGITSELSERLSISLDSRKLYSADGYAAQELLKLAQFIQIAITLANEKSSSRDIHSDSEAEKYAESLASEIAEKKISIQQLLRHEASDAVERANAIEFMNTSSADSETDNIREILEHMICETNDAVERLDRQCKMLMSKNSGMEEKIRKRSIDLERHAKRLESLDLLNVRPAFMDEYEQIEMELQVEYERYVVRFRNIDYLEGELQSKRNAATKISCDARSIKRMQKKFKEEERVVLESGELLSNDKENSKPNGKMT